MIDELDPKVVEEYLRPDPETVAEQAAETERQRLSEKAQREADQQAERDWQQAQLRRQIRERLKQSPEYRRRQLIAFERDQERAFEIGLLYSARDTEARAAAKRATEAVHAEFGARIAELIRRFDAGDASYRELRWPRSNPELKPWRTGSPEMEQFELFTNPAALKQFAKAWRAVNAAYLGADGQPGLSTACRLYRKVAGAWYRALDAFKKGEPYEQHLNEVEGK